jgi:hypothetical protein
MPYKLGWVKDAWQLTLVARRCSILFAIEPFWDIFKYDVTPLDCGDMILAPFYSYDWRAIYDGFHKT